MRKITTEEMVEELLDAAFTRLAWDSDENDFGTISQRKALKQSFEKIVLTPIKELELEAEDFVKQVQQVKPDLTTKQL